MPTLPAPPFTQVVYLHSSIPHLQQRGALWRKKLGARFVFAKDLSDCRITHVVVGEVLGAEAQAALLASLGGARSASTCFMRDTWLCEVALRGGSRPADEQRHVFPVMQCHQQQQPPPAPGSLSAPASAALGGNSSSSRVPRSVPSLPGSLPAPTAPKAGFHRWLGFWSPALDSVTSANELVLHARCDIARSAALGNEPLVAALVELKRYELAVIADRPGASDDVIAHEALGYAKAACAVRACAFPITDELSPQQLQRSLPFVGPFFARLLHSLAETGTCSQLEDYRANRAVRDSRGNVRHHTEGGAVKEQFCRLPNVGPTTAARWFREGYRSLAAVAAAAARRPPEEAPGLAKRDVRYILQVSMCDRSNSAPFPRVMLIHSIFCLDSCSQHLIVLGFGFFTPVLRPIRRPRSSFSTTPTSWRTCRRPTWRRCDRRRWSACRARPPAKALVGTWFWLAAAAGTSRRTTSTS